MDRQIRASRNISDVYAEIICAVTLEAIDRNRTGISQIRRAREGAAQISYRKGKLIQRYVVPKNPTALHDIPTATDSRDERDQVWGQQSLREAVHGAVTQTFVNRISLALSTHLLRYNFFINRKRAF
jgi:hypothetical protein